MSNIFLITLLGISAVAVTSGQNVEAAVGKSVTFPCQVGQDSDSVVWHHYPFGAILPKTVYFDGSVLGSYQDRFTVDKSEDCNLSIRDIRLQDAGKFICTNGIQTKSLELVVLESYPSPHSCASNSSGTDIIGRNSCEIEPDVVSLNCMLRYRGNIPAVLGWTSTSDNSVNASVKTIDNEKTVSTIILQAGQLKSAAYSCFVRYLNSSLVSDFSCTILINVTTLPNRTREISPDCSIQTVSCSTNTRNNCSYTWTNNKNTEISSDSTLALQRLHDGQYICKADCLIRKKRCTFVPLKVNITCGHVELQAHNSGAIAGSVIGGICAAGSIISAAILWKRYRKKLPALTPEDQHLQNSDDKTWTSMHLTDQESKKTKGQQDVDYSVAEVYSLNCNRPPQHDIRIREMQEVYKEKSLCNTDNEKVITADVYDV